LDALVLLDDLAARLTGRGIPDRLLALGKLGTAHQLYIPWMQASYIMVANRAALPYLPDGADINALSYDQLAIWSSVIEQKTGKQLLGFPAGPEGLMHRFLQGFLYPSYTGGVVVPFRSSAAEAMWTQFVRLWRSANPNSTSYNFMRQPLLSGEVWIGFDHIARVLDALRQKPAEFVAFPAPAGPMGRGYMPVLAGLGVMKHAPHLGDATALVDYLTQSAMQIATARSLGFVPAANVSLPSDLDPGLKMGIAAIEQMQSAKNALPALPPIGLGEREEEFDNIFLETFHLIVLRGQNLRAVLDREAEKLNRLMAKTGTPCWQPDPPGTAACQAE
jgi:multiple sugar transport system substrate-binding protein